MLTIKLSDDQAAKLGIKTSEEAIAALESASTNKEKLTQAETENASLSERVGKIEAAVEKLGSDLSAKVLDQTAILDESRKVAKGAASATAAEIIAKTGVSAGQANATDEPTAVKVKPTFEGAVKELVASGKTRAEAIKAVVRSTPELHTQWQADGCPNF